MLNHGKVSSELTTLLNSIPIFIPALILPPGVSNLYSYGGRSFFNKGNDLHYGIGLSAGTWPFSSKFKLERYEGNYISALGANIYFQKTYLPYGFAFKIHYCSLGGIYQFKSGDYELLLNPSLKICLMEWKRLRSFLYLGLISYSRKVYQVEDHINQYPYDSFYSKKDLSGNSVETELQYYISNNFSINLSLAYFNTAKRSRYPIFAGLTYHYSVSGQKPVTLFQGKKEE